VPPDAILETLGRRTGLFAEGQDADAIRHPLELPHSLPATVHGPVAESQVGRQHADIDLEVVGQLANHLPAERPLTRQDFGNG